MCEVSNDLNSVHGVRVENVYVEGVYVEEGLLNA